MDRTIANLLLTARQPLGSTMYVWGGGWNEEDTGAGVEARRIGVSPRWKAFAAVQDAGYDFEDTRYRIHDGLDCSGYVGWVIYNMFESEDGRAGYVMPASHMAWEFAGRGWGKYTSAEYVTDWRAGDIMSMKGHVWISLGMCADGSVVMLHASPPGVILCGTALPEKALGQAIRPVMPSQAIRLAESYMSKCYPRWFSKYPDCGRSISYLEKSSQMRWHGSVLSDKEGLTGKSAKEVLAWLFGEK